MTLVLIGLVGGIITGLSPVSCRCFPSFCSAAAALGRTPPPTTPRRRRRPISARNASRGYHGSTPYVSGQFASPATVPANSFALACPWTIGQESITAGKGAGITLAFHASKVYLDHDH